MTDQPPGYPPPPGGYGYQGQQPPPPSGYGYQSPMPGGYGYPPHPPSGYGYQPVGPGTNGMATASLVCSLVGWICGIGLLLGVIFGFVALSQIKQSGEEGRGMAIAGIIIGALPIVLIVSFYVVVAIAAVVSNQHG